MKSIIAVFAIALSIVMPVQAYASCPDIHSGACCGTYWYEYDWTTACAGTSGSVTGGQTLSCYSTPAYAITGSSGTITYSYTIQSGDPIANTAHWSAGLFVDFDDPNNSQYNTLNVSVGVTHNGSTSSNTILSWDGTQGDIGCGRYDYYFFTAVVGDTVTVTITGSNFNTSNTHIKAAAPFLFNTP